MSLIPRTENLNKYLNFKYFFYIFAPIIPLMNQLTIYDARGTELLTTELNEGCRRRVELMKEDSITLTFSLLTPVHFGIGSYCDLSDEGRRFVVTEQQSPEYNTSTGGNDYELVMEADYMLWKNKIFKFTPEYGGRESSWSMTAPLASHLDVFLRNLDAHGYTYQGKKYTVSIDGSVSTASKFVTYDSTNLIDALNLMAETWECEWWIEYGIIHFGRCENDNVPVDFKVGVNVESMSRSDSKQTYANRIYVFGGEKNIPSRYRKKLEFNVTDVGTDSSGRAWFKDSAREISTEMFPESDVDSDGPYTSDDASAQKSLSTPSSTSYSVVSDFTYTDGAGFSHLRTFPAGTYTIELDGTAQVTWGAKGLPLGTDAFRMIWTITALLDGDEESELWNAEADVMSTTDVSEMPKPPAMSIPLDKDSTLKIRVHGEFAAKSGSLNGYTIAGEISFGVKFTAIGQNDSADVKIAFISGGLNGNIVDGTLNLPHSDEGEGKIYLPSGQSSPSVGDRYTIGNIIGAEVPAGYYTTDISEEMTVNGVVQTRLMLPATWNGGKNYIDSQEGLEDQEIVEAVVVNDDIYPRFGTVDDDGNRIDGNPITGIASRDTFIMDEQTGVREKVTFWAIQDTSISFSDNYRLDGEELTVIFQSGSLNGMEFKASFVPDGSGIYGKPGQWFEIERSDDYGINLPSTDMHPSIGDRYILNGLDSEYLADLGLVAQAEEELLKWGKSYGEKLSIDPSTYTCDMMSDDAYGKDDGGNLDPSYSYKATLLLGDRVKLYSEAYFPDGSRVSRIIGYERCLDIPYDTPKYIVGETASYSRIGEIEDKIKSIAVGGNVFIGNAQTGSSVYVIRSNDTTSPSDHNVFSALRTIQSFLRKDEDDSAKGVITFLHGLLVGDGQYGINGGGEAFLKSLQAEKATLARAAITEVISSITFDEVASFLGGIISNGVQSSEFTQGLQGYSLSYTPGGHSRLEIDELLVRVKAIFNELEIRKLSYSGGNIELSGAGSTIYRSVALTKEGETTPYAWKCYMIKDDGTTRTRNWWRVGDQAKCQTFNIDGEISNGTSMLSLDGQLLSANDGYLSYNSTRSGNSGNRYYWRLVTEVGTEELEDGKDYDYVVLSNEDTVLLENTNGEMVTCIGYDKVFDGGDEDGFKWHDRRNDAPQEGDEIVQEGSQLDPERQHLIRLCVVGENAPAIEEYVGIGSNSTTDDYPNAGPYHLAARRMTAIAPRTGNFFRAKRFEIITDSGQTVRIPVDRGTWSSTETYGYYDRVSHNGSLWLCVDKKGTKTEPSDTNSSWQEQVAAGAPGKDGNANAISASLSPSVLIINENPSGVYDLSGASFSLTVTQGLDDITSECEIVSVSGTGCTVEKSDVDEIIIDSIVGKPDSGIVKANIKIPSQYFSPDGGVITCQATFHINHLGTFSETIENDVKTQIASSEFTYIDDDGNPQTVQGISTLVQTSTSISSQVKGYDHRISSIEQKANEINLKVQDVVNDMAATGINISSHSITVTSDNFLISNNEGETTAAVDKDGNLVAGSLKVLGNEGEISLKIDDDGKPQLIGKNSNGEIVWRLDGNGYVNDTPDVDMIIYDGVAVLSKRVDGYNINYNITVNVTNRNLALITFVPGGTLSCSVQKSKQEGGTQITLTQDKSVAIPSGATAQVTFSGVATAIGTSTSVPPQPFNEGDLLNVRLMYDNKLKNNGTIRCSIGAQSE